MPGEKDIVDLLIEEDGDGFGVRIHFQEIRDRHEVAIRQRMRIKLFRIRFQGHEIDNHAGRMPEVHGDCQTSVRARVKYEVAPDGRCSVSTRGVDKKWPLANSRCT